jgi:outer membrane protein assembly factor BamB
MSRLQVIAIAAFLAACAGGTSNVEPPAPLVSFSPSAKIKTLWSVDVGKGETKKFIELAPVMHEGMLYAIDINGRVGAYAADTGRQRWHVDLNEPVEAAVGFGDGLVLVGTKNANVFALDPVNGKQHWKSAVATEILSRPVADTGVVVVQTIDGRITGLSAQDGRRLWTQQRTQPSLSLRGTATPLISNGVVYAGFASGKLIAVHLESGRPLWERTIAQPSGRNEIERLVDVDAPPLVVGDTLFVVSYQGNVVALDRTTGRVLWSRKESSYSGMVVDGTSLYLTDAEGNVIALDQRSGASLWKQDKLHARLLNAPAVVGGYLAVGDLEGYVHWLTPESGAFVARARVGSGPIRGMAIASGNRLYLQDQAGKLAALEIEEGLGKSR